MADVQPQAEESQDHPPSPKTLTESLQKRAPHLFPDIQPPKSSQSHRRRGVGGSNGEIQSLKAELASCKSEIRILQSDRHLLTELLASSRRHNEHMERMHRFAMEDRASAIKWRDQIISELQDDLKASRALETRPS